MAEDLCLIQYVRDHFGESEYLIQNYDNNVIADDGENTMDTYCLDYANTFPESSTFDQSPASIADPCNPDSTTPFAPDLFSSLSPSCTEGSAAAMESVTGQYGGHSLQVSSSFRNHNLQSFDRPQFPKENEYPMLAAYIGLPHGANSMLQLESDQSGGNCTVTASTSGISSTSELGGRESRTSFWRGKSPALLMQQLKGPSLYSASSCSSTLSKSAPSFSGQRYSLPPLSEHGLNTDSSTKFMNIVASGRVNQGQTRVIRSSSCDGPEMQPTANSISAHLKQRRIQIMPGLDILGEMQRCNSASGNNSWSSCSTSPGPSSTCTDQDIREVAASAGPKFTYNSTMSGDREVAMGGDRAWKKAKRDPGSTSPECEAVTQTVGHIAAVTAAEPSEKTQLQEKFLALLRTVDSPTPKDCKAQILDDSISYLKELRERLNVNEADDSHTHLTTQAESPAASSRGGRDGLASPIHLEDLELETAGVELSHHLNVDNGPQIEVRMMENQHVMVKLTAKDRPGLFNDIMVVLRTLRLDIQHANIRTSNTGQRHDIFAAKMQLPVFSSQSTHSIAMALNQVINGATATPLASPEPHTPQI